MWPIVFCILRAIDTRQLFALTMFLTVSFGTFMWWWHLHIPAAPALNDQALQFSIRHCPVRLWTAMNKTWMNKQMIEMSTKQNLLWGQMAEMKLKLHLFCHHLDFYPFHECGFCFIIFSGICLWEEMVSGLPFLSLLNMAVFMVWLIIIKPWSNEASFLAPNNICR